MPRKPRMYIAGYPYHVIQRGNNRDACFYSEEDYFFILKNSTQLVIDTRLACMPMC